MLLSRDPAGNPAERFQKAKRREIKSPCHAFTHSRDFIRASSGCHQAETSSCSCHSYRSAAMASALQAVGSGKMRGTAPAQQGPPRNPPPSSTNLNCQTKDTFSKSAKYSPSFQALPIEDGTKPRKACNEASTRYRTRQKPGWRKGQNARPSEGEGAYFRYVTDPESRRQGRSLPFITSRCYSALCSSLINDRPSSIAFSFSGIKL